MDLGGAKLFKHMLDRNQQEVVVNRVRDVVAQVPLFHPVTASGRRMSVRMTSCGRLGWVSDRQGYRYETHHPNGTSWPKIPDEIQDVWKQVSDCDVVPDSCLLNFYGEGAKMGMHQDRDEGDFSFPVVSISLGDDALFRIGGTARGGKTQSAWLGSGDVLVLKGAARLAYHGIDRLRFRSSDLLKDHGRINLTLRVVR
ncbi:alpha-ketoglutarate-dependent dioxygenase AlkB [Aliiroseovarius sp. KMU-50]|uniref:Alpha-ketoglutarate-dependent dioxygenase AlkB n=2 Tax=Aliiroseovarius salicola TaxID=3009082 RepID=A0ABT4VXQ0_9RHOB|nr:alpha-ketoglutarate-dependent dioxygenase AlkB [Aliiroseovarius sp. KMU-50]MDA5093029.1 alpha-ketoglutarate-dependent dioxygenase AlkB [Aliiroseovarius sp. KMU-50]